MSEYAYFVNELHRRAEAGRQADRRARELVLLRYGRPPAPREEPRLAPRNNDGRRIPIR